MAQSPASASASVIIQNRYRWRLSAKETPCWICLKSSNNILVSGDEQKPADFFYICRSHILDTSFARPFVDPAAAAAKGLPAASTTAAAAVTSTDAQPATATAGQEDTAGKDASPKPSPATAAAGPKEYVLHSNFFYLRQNEKKKKSSSKDKMSLFESLQSIAVPNKKPGGVPGAFPDEQ